MQLTEGEYLVIQVVPCQEGRPYTKKNTKDFFEASDFCQSENFMSDYNLFKVFVIKNGLIYETTRDGINTINIIEWDED